MANESECFDLARCLQVFEMYLKKMGGECVDLRVNYDKFPAFVENSLGQSKFWQIVNQLVETLQAMVKERAKTTATTPTCEKDVFKDIKDKNQSWKILTMGNTDNSSFKVDPSLVQITADKSEIDRRIAAFLKKKQVDVDIHNQREFCNLLSTENEYSCARVDAVFLPRVGQKSHITVTNANRENEIMKSDSITVDTMLYSFPSKRQKNTDGMDELPYSVEERLDNIQSHLKMSGMKSVELDVYSRIKKLEEKILYLEGLSPEYFNYKSGSSYTDSRRMPSNRKTGSAEQLSYNNDLDERMLILKEKLLSEKLTRKS